MLRFQSFAYESGAPEQSKMLSQKSSSFSVSHCSRSSCTSSSPCSPMSPQRADLNLALQRSSAKAWANLGHSTWVSKQETDAASKDLDYHRHSLKSLVVEARRQQLAVKARKDTKTQTVDDAQTSDLETMMKTEAVGNGNQSLVSSFDLTSESNAKHLLNDIDLLLNLAEERKEKDSVMEGRLVASTLDQLAKLSLWKE